MTLRIVALAVALSILVACGGNDEPAAVPEEAPDRVSGVILDISSEGLQDVTSFTLKDGDTTYEIFIADDVEYGFPLGHLQEHLSTADPVAVDLELREDDRLYALTIEDV